MIHSGIMVSLGFDEIKLAVGGALAEDIGAGDVTTLACVGEHDTLWAVLRARENLVACGLAFAETAFRHLSKDVVVERHASDGDMIRAGGILLSVKGSARAILSAERVALNFVQRLSGISTLTAKYVEAVKGTRARILDTRKTTPGGRRFEKYAVHCGGGQNHRAGLHDMILVKDNHLAALREELPNAIAVAVQRARVCYPHLRVEVEADTIIQVRQAVEAGADIVLLDNMNLAQLREAVALARNRIQTEASGGVNLDSVRAIAETGVDLISVGALTHSARSMDIGLDFQST